MKKYYVEWFIEEDPIKFFDNLVEAKIFASDLFQQQIERNKGSDIIFGNIKEFSVLGEINKEGKKEILLWQGFEKKYKEYCKQIEEEFKDFKNQNNTIINKATKFYGAIIHN